ncbi:hypothetical protein BESB_056480 [Besnoitia besnoiti]|uniref:Uncharacterized protein n=1 Tax=Besnoitia besnoiti TaxID=94643 RepID=A0A2A9MK64_BESBE|nr:hypothetical protein BESB_056480 [Besnoitia besnoiti]PFH35997.1 hypothetical protein BESB_056480 [Besnoitia besnoiti]
MGGVAKAGGLGKQALRAFRSSPFILFLSVRKGLEPVLLRELRTSPSLRDICGKGDASSRSEAPSFPREDPPFGGEKRRNVRLQCVQGGVILHGADWEVASRVCAYTRVAEAVWLRLAHSGGCTNEQKLETALRKVKWEEFFPNSSILPLVPLRVSSFASALCNERRIRQVVRETLERVNAECRAEQEGTPPSATDAHGPSAAPSPVSLVESPPSSASAPPSAESAFLAAMEPARRLMEALNFRFSVTLASDSLFVDVQLSPRLTPRPYLYLSRFLSPAAASRGEASSGFGSSPPLPPACDNEPSNFASAGDAKTAPDAERAVTSQAASADSDACGRSPFARDLGEPSSSLWAGSSSASCFSGWLPPLSEELRPCSFPVLRKMLDAREQKRRAPETFADIADSPTAAGPSRGSGARAGSPPPPWSLVETSQAIRRHGQLRLLRERYAAAEREARGDAAEAAAEAREACGRAQGEEAPREEAPAGSLLSAVRVANEGAGAQVRVAGEMERERIMAFWDSAERQREREARARVRPRWQKSAFEKLLDSLAKAEQMATEGSEKFMAGQLRYAQGGVEDKLACNCETKRNVSSGSLAGSAVSATRNVPETASSCSQPPAPTAALVSPSCHVPSAALHWDPPPSVSCADSPSSASTRGPAPLLAATSVSAPSSPVSRSSASPSLPLRLPIEVELLRLQHLHFGRRQAAARAAGLLPPAALASVSGLVEAYESDDAMAAAVALASGIKRACRREKDVVVWDPFCGDGGLLLEVALLIKDDFPICPPRVPSALARLRGVRDAWPRASASASSSRELPASPSSLSKSLVSASESPASDFRRCQGAVTLVGSDERALLLRAARERVRSFCAFYSRGAECGRMRRALASPEVRDAGEARGQPIITGQEEASDREQTKSSEPLRSAQEAPTTGELEDEHATTAINRRAAIPMFTRGPQIVPLSSDSAAAATPAAARVRADLDSGAQAISFDQLVYGRSLEAEGTETEDASQSTHASPFPRATATRQTAEPRNLQEGDANQAGRGDRCACDEKTQDAPEAQREEPQISDRVFTPDETDTAWEVESFPFRFALLHASHHHVATFLKGAFILTRMPGRREGEFMGSAHKKAVLLYERFGHLIASRDDWRAVYVVTKGSAFQHYSRLDWERVLTWRDVSDQPLQLLRWTGRKRALYASTTKAERENVLEEIDTRLDAADA